MFVGYAKHTNRFSNARVATLMIDKLLQKFRRQLEIYNETIEENMETKHFEMPVDEVGIQHCRSRLRFGRLHQVRNDTSW